VRRREDRLCRNPDFAGVEALQAKKCLSPKRTTRA
jgi:hypothetical protein